MIVCKITLNNQPDIDYNAIIDKVLSNGDFLISSSDNQFEILFSSDKDEVNESYIRKMLRKFKIDFMLHEYTLNEKLDLDLYTNQWIVVNLDRQFKIRIEREKQPELRQISRKLDLLNKVTDEMILAKQRYEEKLVEIQANGENQEKEGQNG